MSERLFPSLENLRSHPKGLTPGEDRLITFLDEHLPRDEDWKEEKGLEEYNGWLLFAKPRLNGLEPDLVAFHPKIGAMIYEVKDWNLNNYKITDDGEGRKVLKVRDKRGWHEIKNPVSQVEHYKKTIIEQLVPGIGEEIDNNKAVYGVIRNSIYFFGSKTYHAKRIFGSKIKKDEYFPIFGDDYLNQKYIENVNPLLSIGESKFWKKGWSQELLFWLKPPYHTIEQGESLALTGGQKKIGDINPGHHRVKGVAGSGKTQALAYRAASLASNGYQVLVVTYNYTLWHYIRPLINRSPLNFSWGKIDFNHFHGLLRDKLNENGVEWPKGPEKKDFEIEEEFQRALEEFFQKRVPQYFRANINMEDLEKYDAILIDEGQDYCFEWYDLLKDFFLSPRDELIVVVDKRQNIYKRELEWIDKRKTKTGMDKFQTDIIKLEKSFRNPPEIGYVANQFAQRFGVISDVGDIKYDQSQKEIRLNHVVWVNLRDEDYLEWVYYAYRRLHKARESIHDIVFLLPNHEIGSEVANYFNNKGVQVDHVFDVSNKGGVNSNKKAFWMEGGRVKMSTIHSFKGWEMSNVVLMIPEFHGGPLSKLDSSVYTAITRSRSNLIVLNYNPRYFEFGETLPKTWDEALEFS